MNDRIKDVSKLALAGLLGGSLTFATVGCESQGKTDKTGSKSSTKTEAMQKMAHECAGLNSCKGLGGCKVTEEKLASLAKKAGVAMDKAGSAHDCKGMNACKGLGGCQVSMTDLETLKAKQN